MSSVDTRHEEYSLELDTWRKIEHITRIRFVENYLVALNPQDTSEDNRVRNEQYKKRAVFYAIAAATVSGLVGTLFRRDPILQVPDELAYMARNCDGANTSIYQQSQSLADDIIRKSRAGLYVSFPATDGMVSRADLIEGRVVSTITRFEPEQIINWRVETVNNQRKIRFVVIEELREKLNRYTVDRYRYLRELYLDEEGIYRERHWSDENQSLQVVAEYTPTDADGNTWEIIPFIFVGAVNNDEKIDRAVMLPLVELNIGHYRNSADWEDNVWYVGQSQPYMTNLTEHHLELMRENNMYVGSRQLLGVPDGGTFGFASAPANPLVRQAMLDKVDMMVQLGARLIQPGTAPRTATEAAGMLQAQHSVLSLIAANISEAYTQCLQWAARYIGVAEGEGMENIDYHVHQDFVEPETNPQELQQMMMGWVQGSVPLGDYVRYMQERGLFHKDKPVEEYGEDLGRGVLPGTGVVS
jgi:hypothetical protein